MEPKLPPNVTENDVSIIKEMLRNKDTQGAKEFMESKGLVFEEYGIAIIPSYENKHS